MHLNSVMSVYWGGRMVACLKQPAALPVAGLSRGGQAIRGEECKQEVADQFADIEGDGAHARKLGVDHVRRLLAGSQASTKSRLLPLMRVEEASSLAPPSLVPSTRSARV